MSAHGSRAGLHPPSYCVPPHTGLCDLRWVLDPCVADGIQHKATLDGSTTTIGVASKLDADLGQEHQRRRVVHLVKKAGALEYTLLSRTSINLLTDLEMGCIEMDSIHVSNQIQ